MALQPVLIAGEWRAANAYGSFRAQNPATGEPLPDEFPVSSWADCEAALAAAGGACEKLRTTSPEQIAKFLTRYADHLDARASEIVALAHLETALPVTPRLAQAELPRTTAQLRQAAAAALELSWALPTIDTKLNIRSVYAPLGPVLVFGPNNFPLAFNGVSGGDFAAAIAAGNPVIAKAHPSHPGTSRLMAVEALAAVAESGLAPGTVQMLYKFSHEDGLRLVSDQRLAAVGFTGSRAAGLKLKGAADALGKPAYLEMSSVNPILILPGALDERDEKIAEEFSTSCLMGSGQFCTSPGVALLLAGNKAESFINALKSRLENTPSTPLLSAGVARSLLTSIQTLRAAGAQLVAGGAPIPERGARFANTLLRASGDQFLASPDKLQTEAFGNATMAIVARDAEQAAEILSHLEGNLTGSIYSDTRGSDDTLYARLAPILRSRVGRLLNDKMPTGVAVSSAMNHGGPFPATGHPGFTSVGIPASLRRFAMLQCFDNVRPQRLPDVLQDKNPTGKTWRLIDGQWSQADVAG